MPLSELSRRRLLMGAGALAVGGLAANAANVLRQPKARVFGLRCTSYEEDLVGRILEGIAAFPQVAAKAKGGRVVLKPNLVEIHPGRPVNTEPRLIVAAIEAFRRIGAREVVVAEGPGHQRDTDAILEASGLGPLLDQVHAPYLDLNVDEWAEAELPGNYTRQGRLPIATTILGADLVVSMPKLKTHHWAGATLSMKNLFGTVPGVAVGWPKNRLHWSGIEESIVDLWSAIRPGFAIVDGVVGMEGDGPIMGTPVSHGILLFGDHLPAVDATAARLMGLRPGRIRYLQLALGVGGTLSSLRIEQTGDELPVVPYSLLPRWQLLRA